MKNLTEKLFSIMLIFVMIFTMSTNAFASELVPIEQSANATIVDISNEGESVEFSLESKSKAIPNFVGGIITPYSTYYKIGIINSGIDRLSSATLSIDLYDNITGEHLDSTTKSYTNVKVGTTYYNWYKSKSDTIEERIEVTLVAHDGATYYGSAETVRWNFKGGSYGTISALGGQVHHCPADSINGLTTYSGPAIRMLTDDHKQTASYGSSTSARNYRASQKALIDDGNFDEAMQMDIDDIRDNFGTKYNKAIDEMIEYAEDKNYISTGSVK